MSTNQPNPNPPIDARKRELRHELLAQRRHTTDAERAAAGERCAASLFALPLFSKPRTTPLTMACHVSMGTEISTLPILNEAASRGIELLVPRLGSGREIGWSRLTSPDEVTALHHEHAAGDGHMPRPDEPDTGTLPTEALADADIIVLPALAVDHGGGRLGRGAGWYDHALEYARPAAPRIAMCWSCEFVATPLPTQPHDMPVDAVLTPQRLVFIQ